MKKQVELHLSLTLYCEIVFFWVVTPCSVVVGCQRFGGPCCFHLQGEENGARKKGIDLVMEYKRGQSMAANRKLERMLILAVGRK
jgi:hypothetical protein